MTALALQHALESSLFLRCALLLWSWLRIISGFHFNVAFSNGSGEDMNAICHPCCSILSCRQIDTHCGFNAFLPSLSWPVAIADFRLTTLQDNLCVIPNCTTSLPIIHPLCY